MENWNRFLEEPAADIKPILDAIAEKIKKISSDSLNLPEEEFKELIVGIYEKHYDETEEGWDPYPGDIKYIKNRLLGPPDEEDDELAPDDYEDPPGYMPGDNKTW